MTCHVRKKDSEDDLEFRGKSVDVDGLHAFLCPSGPARYRTHKALISKMRQELIRVGAVVDVERCCPELYRRKSDGSWREARLDLVVRFPGCVEAVLLDVTVQCPHAKGRDRACCVPGLAAKAGEQAKLARYGTTVRPLSFESHGRLGMSSLNTLADLAAWAVAVSPGQGLRESRLVRRWRLALETILMSEKADIMVQSLGGLAATWLAR
jgi:hypothetical protein